MKKQQWLTLFALGLLLVAAPSSFADWRSREGTPGQTPNDSPRDRGHQRDGTSIVLDGQIAEAGRDGDAFVFSLIRQKVRIVAWPSTNVREVNGDRIHVAVLQPRDVIHVSGTLDGNTVYAYRIVRQLHIEYRSGAR